MLEAQIEALSGQMEEARSKASEAALAKQRLESQIELLKEQINTAKANDEHIQNDGGHPGEQAQRKELLAGNALQKRSLQEELGRPQRNRRRQRNIWPISVGRWMR